MPTTVGTIKHRHHSVLPEGTSDVDVSEWNDSEIVGGGTNGDVFTRDGAQGDGWGWAPFVGVYAPLASPALTGVPTVPTAAPGTNTTQAASTAFVQTELGPKAPLASPALTGVPTAPTATAGTNTTQLATTAFMQAAAAAALVSPAFTGTPTAPTATPGTNTTQLATTAFVTAAAAPPAWVAVAYSSSNFVGTGGMGWTVDAGDQVRFSYLLSGKTMTVSFWLNTTTLAGTATNEIRLTIPAGKVSAAYAAGIVWLSNPASILGVINAPAGAAYLQLYKGDQSNYTLGTNTWTISGTFTFEVN